MTKPKLYQVMLHFLVGLLILNIAVVTIKNVVKQPRPTTILKDYSFPSQHSANAFFGAIYFILVLSRHKKKLNPILVWGLSAGLLILAAMVAYSRIYLNVHYWPDVIFGSIMGVMFGLIFAYIKI